MPKDHPELSFEMVEGGEFQGEHVRNLILAEEKKLGDRKNDETRLGRTSVYVDAQYRA